MAQATVSANIGHHHIERRYDSTTYKRPRLWSLGAPLVFLTKAQVRWIAVIWVLSLVLAGFAGGIVALSAQ